MQPIKITPFRLAIFICLGFAIIYAVITFSSWYYDEYYGFHTPPELKKNGLCIQGNRFGGSSDFFDMTAVKCATGETVATLSNATEIDFLDLNWYFPSVHLSYGHKDGKLRIYAHGGGGGDLEWEFDDKSAKFTLLHGSTVP